MRIKSTLLVPQLQTDSFVSCLSIWSLSLLHPFNFSLCKCGLLFHVCVVFASEQSFLHNLSKVLIVTTTLCILAKKEIIYLLLIQILKYSFTSSSTQGILLRQSYALFDVSLNRSTFILRCQHFDFIHEIVFCLYSRHFNFILEVHNENKKLPPDISLSHH